VKLLIVDDEIELVETLVARLKRRRIEAVGTANGHDALAQLEVGTFDVVLIDVKMPGIDGLDLLRMIKERYPGQQVVMLTGHGSAKHAEDGLRLGAHDYLMKPVKLAALIDILTDAAKQREDGR
jgi:DNA-binding NtrC family response regulator